MDASAPVPRSIVYVAHSGNGAHSCNRAGPVDINGQPGTSAFNCNIAGDLMSKTLPIR